LLADMAVVPLRNPSREADFQRNTGGCGVNRTTASPCAARSS
jgi:hypothetical protein